MRLRRGLQRHLDKGPKQASLHTPVMQFQRVRISEDAFHIFASCAASKGPADLMATLSKLLPSLRAWMVMALRGTSLCAWHGVPALLTTNTCGKGQMLMQRER